MVWKITLPTEFIMISIARLHSRFERWCIGSIAKRKLDAMISEAGCKWDEKLCFKNILVSSQSFVTLAQVSFGIFRNWSPVSRITLRIFSKFSVPNLTLILSRAAKLVDCKRVITIMISRKVVLLICHLWFFVFAAIQIDLARCPLVSCGICCKHARAHACNLT